MPEKRRVVIKDIRPVTAQLDSTDALKLAVADERFARALIDDPEKFRELFNLRDIEVDAIRDSLDHIVQDGGGDGYE